MKRNTMDLKACTEAIRTKVGSDSGLAATLKFDCGAEGVIYIDANSTPNTVSNDNSEAQCTIGITLENLSAMLEGDLDPTTGFMMGKLKVTGDMSVAMRLQRVI
jgi:putative sterol carrier protein